MSDEQEHSGASESLIRIWPLFGLVITTPRLVLTPGETQVQQDLVLSHEDFIRPHWDAGFRGVAAARTLLMPDPA